MKKLKKQIIAFCTGVALMLSALPMTAFGADGGAVSVSFDGNTTYYSTIDAAWEAAVALDTTAEKKATVKLLADCTAENTLTNTEDYLVLDTNKKTLTTPDAIYTVNDVKCGISVTGGSLELIGNGTITGVSRSDFTRAILLITGGKVSADGITIHNTGKNGSNPVRIAGGEFYLLDGHLITDDEYALYADTGKVYLYSGTLETGKTARMVTDNGSGAEIQICYSEQPLYFVMSRAVWRIIDNTSYVHLEDNLVMDLEYSDNPDGSDSKMLRNVTQIDDVANEGRSYLKIQTYKPSYMFSTTSGNTLLSKIKSDGVTDLDVGGFTAVHFVDLADYDLTNVTYSDYSEIGDGSVKAWVDGTELYIGGYRKIIAGSSLYYAFEKGVSINEITGIEMLDTSNVKDMGYMFERCGADSESFKLDLGDNFDTSNVTRMSSMFMCCGENSPVFTLNLGNKFDTSKVTYTNYMFMCCGEKSNVFTLDLGDKFDTSKVKNMSNMFTRCGSSSKVFTLDLGDKFYTSNVTIGMSLMFNQCGQSSEVFKELDLSSFTFLPEFKDSLVGFAANIPVTKFIFGKGWRNAVLPAVGISSFGFAKSSSNKPTEIVGATKNLRTFDWTSDNRTVTFTDNITYTITPDRREGGTVSGGGPVLDGESVTLTATAYEGYTFDGWYDGDTKVCETEVFVIENVAEDKTYMAEFINDTVYYTITAEVGTEGGGTVSGGGEVAEGDSITLTAAANDGYTFAGWYDGETKVCETAEFTVENVTANKTYTAKFTAKVSRLFNTAYMDGDTLLSKIKTDKVTTVSYEDITAVHFVDLADYDLTNVAYADYSADGDGSVKAWIDNGTELYIGGYGKIIAGESLAHAFRFGKKIESITGFDRLDTSNVTDMKCMFVYCGYEAKSFDLDLGDNFDTSNVTTMASMFDYCGVKNKLDLGDKFDTSKVTDMSYMFGECGANASNFTLDFGDKFDTSNVTNMMGMFYRCGRNNYRFNTLDLSKFTVGASTDLRGFASDIFVTTFIFGEGWTNATFPKTGVFYNSGKPLDTTVIGATENLINYDWAEDNRAANGLKDGIYIITAKAGSGGTVAGSGEVAKGGSVTLTATADKGYTFDCWYDNNTKVCDTEEFTVENVTGSKIYKAQFTRIYYTITAEVGTEGGGTVSGGGKVASGNSVTLTAAANDGYTFDGWYDGETKVCDTAKFVVSDVTENKTYTAKFKKNITYYTITAEVGTEGGGTVSGGGEVAGGDSVTLTAAANDGYTFDGWYDGETKVCDTAEFTVENVMVDKTYTAKFTERVSRLFSITKESNALLNKIKNDNITTVAREEITAVHFVDLADYDLTNVAYSDYSADGDGSVKAWMDGTELYIGGYGKIIAGESLACAFIFGEQINSITGLDMLDTSKVTDMNAMFYCCGKESSSFELDLGKNFDTSNVTDMRSMFGTCGYSSQKFTLDLGDKFDTSKVTKMMGMFYECGAHAPYFTLDLGNKFYTPNVTDMRWMFAQCGQKSSIFKTLDLSTFTVGASTDLKLFAKDIPVTKFIFGEGWTNAALPEKAFYNSGNPLDTTVVGATENLISYDWAEDNRAVNGLKDGIYIITAKAGTGGTVSGGGEVASGSNVTLTATADDGYTFDSWYDGNKKVCETAEFALENVTRSKIYNAQFERIYHTITAAADEGGTVTGGGKVAEGDSITLTATAKDGYTLDGWYDGETKVCETAKYTAKNVMEDKTYTAKFTRDIAYYTITATADEGGTVAGGGKVAKGDSITLTATANNGYTFDGWYDGETKVCETAKYTVENVMEDKTYTAKFAKNQIEPDPEPENPEIPYLKWDGSTLTLVKKADASCRVGIVYVGGATFDADNISWDKLVAVGKEYANLNSSVGYAVYSNFTKRTPGTRGNYVAFVKYTKDDGTTTADYITFSVKDAVSFEIPALSYNTKKKTLRMTGDVSSTVGIAYIGDTEFNTGNITWNDFIKAGKKYPDINGTGGYEKVIDTLDFAKTFDTDGNYAAFIKYYDENLKKSIAKYYTFTVDDSSSQPTNAPFAVAEEKQVVLTANGFEVTKVTIVYIGTEDINITNWSEFSAAAAKFRDINGKDLNQQYANPKDGSAWTQETAGWYGVYIRYLDNSKKCNSYYTVEIN